MLLEGKYLNSTWTGEWFHDGNKLGKVRILDKHLELKENNKGQLGHSEEGEE